MTGNKTLSIKNFVEEVLISETYLAYKFWQKPKIQVPCTGSIENLSENLTLVVERIAHSFDRNCEVVHHDLRHPERSIVAISNGHVTKRKVGGPIIGVHFRLDPSSLSMMCSLLS